MTIGNFWTLGDLREYLELCRRIKEAREQKIHRVRGRLKSGYYMTDEVARATAEKMIDSLRYGGLL